MACGQWLDDMRIKYPAFIIQFGITLKDHLSPRAPQRVGWNCKWDSFLGETPLFSTAFFTFLQVYLLGALSKWCFAINTSLIAISIPCIHIFRKANLTQILSSWVGLLHWQNMLLHLLTLIKYYYHYPA